MRKFLPAIFFSFLLTLSMQGFSEKPNSKFGVIKPADFSTSVYSVDSSASGVVLFDIGSSKCVGNTSGHFSIEFKRHTRVHLLNRNSFDLASIIIPLYASGVSEERIETLEASTYNL